MLTLNLFVRVKPEYREELLEAGRLLFEELAKQPTFIQGRVHTSEEEPDLIVVYEQWRETKDSFQQNILPLPIYKPYLAVVERTGATRAPHWLDQRYVWGAEVQLK